MSYLFLIIPPIVIIVSLAILIYLVYRKAGDISEAKDSDFSDLEDKFKVKEKFDFSKTHTLFLKFLEKIISGFKRALENWHLKLQERQKSKAESKFNFKEDIAEEEDFNDEKENRFKLKFKKNPRRRIKANIKRTDIGKKKEESEEKIVIKEEEEDLQPMLKNEVVYPEAPENDVESSLEDRLISKIAANPKDIRAYENLGNFYLRNENFKDALNCYKQIMKIDPRNRQAKLGMRRLEKIIN